MEIYASLEGQRPNIMVIQLSNDILDDLNNGNLKLKSKSIHATPFLVTNNHTFKLRIQNHSNCQLLLKCDNEEKSMNTITSFSNVLIPQLVDGELNHEYIKSFNSFEEFAGATENGDELATWKQTTDVSTCSDSEFVFFIEKNSIFYFNNQLWQPQDKFKIVIIGKFVNILIKNLNSSLVNWDFQLLDSLDDELIRKSLDDLVAEVSTETSIDRFLTNIIVSPIVKSYLNTQKGLDHREIIKLISLDILKTQSPIKYDELLIQLRMNLNPEYTPDIDPRDALLGHYYTLDQGDTFIFIDKTSLSMDLRTRVQSLFGLCGTWDPNELTTFIVDLNPKKLPLQRLIGKWVKVQKNGCTLRK